MIKPFTPNDLIRYIYQEMDGEEHERIVQALREDESLLQAYIELLSTMEHLDQLSLTPPEHVTKAIFKKAKSTGIPQV